MSDDKDFDEHPVTQLIEKMQQVIVDHITLPDIIEQITQAMQEVLADGNEKWVEILHTMAAYLESHPQDMPEVSRFMQRVSRSEYDGLGEVQLATAIIMLSMQLRAVMIRLIHTGIPLSLIMFFAVNPNYVEQFRDITHENLEETGMPTTPDALIDWMVNMSSEGFGRINQMEQTREIHLKIKMAKREKENS